MDERLWEAAQRHWDNLEPDDDEEEIELEDDDEHNDHT